MEATEIRYTRVPVKEGLLASFFKEIFLKHWRKISFGPCIDGAVFEIHAGRRPKSVTCKGGYLTVDLGRWHFHLCLGNHRASRALLKRRRPRRAAFFESKNQSCVPRSYGFRMWNGRGEQMISIFFQNPYLDDHGRYLKKLDWRRTRLWERMKRKYAR